MEHNCERLVCFLTIALNLKMAIISISYWPITLDDDARFIGTILDEKVENVIDKDHVIDALKNGIHLNDYVKTTEN